MKRGHYTIKHQGPNSPNHDRAGSEKRGRGGKIREKRKTTLGSLNRK